MSAQLLLALFVKGTAIVAVAWAVTTGCRKASAAARHFVWLTALAALLLLPVTLKMTPKWTPVAPTGLERVAKAGRTVMQVTAGGGRSPFPWQAWLLGLWAAGALSLLLRRGVAQAASTRLSAAAEPWRQHDGLPVKLSGTLSTPLLAGVLRPEILLPAEAADWDAERLAVVLRHEAAHAERRDPLAQLLAAVVCAVYWPLPWVWAAARRLAMEAELACDDGVLRSGSRATDYAGHLLEITRGLLGRKPVPEGGIPMARISNLEQRLKAMLNTQTNRLPAGRRLMLAVAGAAVALLIPLAALDAPLAAMSDGITGIVKDASGATVPRARVTVQFTDGSRREVVYTTDAGEFTAAPLPNGDYVVTVEKPGFAALKLTAIPVGPGLASRLDLVLQAGSVRESLTVVGEGAPAEKLKSTGIPSRIRVGGNVQATKMVKQVRPSYPPECKADRVQGTVLLRAVISKEGVILNLEPINQLVDSRLVQAAVDAVKQWVYQPTLLNGNPVEVLTEIEINFTLAS
ncbi:MAG: TonB family protein [Acidobacteria bacterium]|nr:TonB family protein [Acidobacteriota bacterium]